jgi:hypothetical protein
MQKLTNNKEIIAVNVNCEICVKLVRLSEPVISAAVWHVVPDRVADLLEGEQLSHDRQLEWPVVVLNHHQIHCQCFRKSNQTIEINELCSVLQT